jgi:hypothetical protein
LHESESSLTFARFAASTSQYGLQLNNNKLGGTIPTEFGKFTGLGEYERLIYIHFSRLMQRDSILNCVGFLNVKDNELTGATPSELGLLVALSEYFPVPLFEN